MYTPDHFRIEDREQSFDIIEQNPFGMIVSPGDDGAPDASHAPFHLLREKGENGTLQFHLARANPQAKRLDGRSVRCIFAGPHAYVSPTWYAAGPAVPTWNYVAVHCLGRAVRIEDPEVLAAQMRVLSGAYEDGGPWRFDELPEKFRAGMLKGIIGFELRIDQIVGKAKLSQNRSESDIENTAAALEMTDRGEDAAVAALMRTALDG